MKAGIAILILVKNTLKCTNRDLKNTFYDVWILLYSCQKR